MSQTLRTAVLLVTFPTIVAAQTPAKKPMEGAWKVAEIAVTGTTPSNNPNPQPGLFIFGQRHYSMMWVPGNQPRALSKAAQLTNEEKLQAYDSFLANAGTYEVAGSTITIRPMVARVPNFMAGGFSKYEFRVEGNNLWLTEKSADLHARVGEQVVPLPGAAFERRFKLLRLE